jgi:cytochrome c oxidase assembly factor CtaG
MNRQNDQNPYVFNPYLYANSVDATFYEQTTFFLVHKLLNLAAFVSGFLSCSMSIYLIAFKSPEHLKQYSRVLLLCACSDMIYLFCGFWCQAVGFFDLGFQDMKNKCEFYMGILEKCGFLS